MFSSEFCKISKNTSFTERLWTIDCSLIFQINILDIRSRGLIKCYLESGKPLSICKKEQFADWSPKFGDQRSF